MQQADAERRMKTLQKSFLSKLEEHPALIDVDTTAFNNLRKRVFRGTFAAFHLGVTGRSASVWEHFFGWLEDSSLHLPPEVEQELAHMCFQAALESYRIGAMVAGKREG